MKALEALSYDACSRPKCSQDSQSMFRISRMGRLKHQVGHGLLCVYSDVTM